MKALITSLILSTLPTAALAASTTTTYNSGILVLGFIALCALIVAVQLIPAILMLAGALKALFSSKKEEAPAKQ
jgi:ABC-type uncharacterized transport system permease subunit